MPWTGTVIPEAEAELLALPTDMQTRFLHIAELLTDKLEAQCEGLSRDVKVRTGRFNQHIAPRCVLIECGTNENTLEEVLCGIPYLAQAIAETLDALEAETMSNEE